jgi:hypothetical protein
LAATNSYFLRYFLSVILSEAKDLYVQKDPSFRFASLRMTTFWLRLGRAVPLLQEKE